MNELLFSNYLNKNIKKDFINKIIHISNKLNIEPNWLMYVIYKESYFNPKAQNKHTKATGLIQFMPQTANYLNTSIDELLNMNEIEQLDYVYKYFKTYKNKIHSAFDLYSAVFFPLMLSKNDDFILETKNLPSNLIAQQNPAFDLNKDNKITKGEFKKWFNKEYDKIQNLYYSNSYLKSYWYLCS